MLKCFKGVSLPCRKRGKVLNDLSTREGDNPSHKVDIVDLSNDAKEKIKDIFMGGQPIPPYTSVSNKNSFPTKDFIAASRSPVRIIDNRCSDIAVDEPYSIYDHGSGLTLQKNSKYSLTYNIDGTETRMCSLVNRDNLSQRKHNDILVLNVID